jgi:UDP-N-acetylmuramoylalanine--D-glutamate ligase
LPEGGVYVLELSSYQLDLTYSLDCEVAVLTNITPDHLDRYASFEAYAASKARLFEMQTATHVAVISQMNPVAARLARVLLSEAHDEDLRCKDRKRERWPTVALTSIDARRDAGFQQDEWPVLQGPHNAENAAVSIAASFALGIHRTQIRKGLRTFAGLPHRMERVAEKDGVLFINDSKATNPASTAPALAAWPPNPDKRIHWICGGLPKTDDLDECAPNFGNVVAAYTIGEAGPRFAEILEPHMPVERCEMLCEAVKRAIAAAKPGEVVLFSPACASFDQFRDYETRGDSFRSLVAGLTGGTDDQREGFTARSAA